MNRRITIEYDANVLGISETGLLHHILKIERLKNVKVIKTDIVDNSKDEVKAFGELLGINIHTALRKWCDSKESHLAWEAIHNMPNNEWSNLCLRVAELMYDKKE